MKPITASAIFLITASPVLAETFEVDGNAGSSLTAQVLNSFDEPWAMTFLPTGEMLVTEKSGSLKLVSADGVASEDVANVPKVDYGGQGGLGDVVLDPDYASNNRIWISYAEAGDGSTRGAAVTRATLVRDGGQPSLSDVEVVWRQTPKTSGRGHYSHRLLFTPDGKLLITSGDRQKLDPAQDMNSSLGKLIRINLDGTPPPDNPFQDDGELAKSFWSIGHRNLLGIAYDTEGNLWQHEMGPRHGDEINLIVKGENYGWPIVSNGDHYSGAPIPDHDTRPEFEAPKAFWVPTIAPSGLVIYDGDVFPEWKNDAFIGGLRSMALIRVDIDGTSASEAERFSWGKRIREVEQGPDGHLYVLEDNDGGRLLRLSPDQ